MYAQTARKVARALAREYGITATVRVGADARDYIGTVNRELRATVTVDSDPTPCGGGISAAVFGCACRSTALLDLNGPFEPFVEPQDGTTLAVWKV